MLVLICATMLLHLSSAAAIGELTNDFDTALGKSLTVRDSVNFTSVCQDIVSNRVNSPMDIVLCAFCKDKNGYLHGSKLGLNSCLLNDDGIMKPLLNGDAFRSCYCRPIRASFLYCKCLRYGHNSDFIDTDFDLATIVSVDEHGHLSCLSTEGTETIACPVNSTGGRRDEIVAGVDVLALDENHERLVSRDLENFQQSCQNFRPVRRGDTLDICGFCEAGNHELQGTQIDLDQCLFNRNGRLMIKALAKIPFQPEDVVPDQQFRGSCQDCKLFGTQLTCLCRDDSGFSIMSQVDLAAVLSNRLGYLSCFNVGGSKVPGCARTGLFAINPLGKLPAIVKVAREKLDEVVARVHEFSVGLPSISEVSSISEEAKV